MISRLTIQAPSQSILVPHLYQQKPCVKNKYQSHKYILIQLFNKNIYSEETANISWKRFMEKFNQDFTADRKTKLQ